MKKISQSQQILDYIKENGSISHFEAISQLGILAFTARISELRRQGNNIISYDEVVPSRHGTAHIKRYTFKSVNDIPAEKVD